MRTLAPMILALAATTVQAAATAEFVTPGNTSVEVLQSQMISARYRLANGAPSVGEAVTFVNPSCGTFPNGMSQIVVNTDAQGVASTTFTAGINVGVTCTVTATAGAAAVRFQVVSYRLDLVVIGIETLAVPNPPLPGRPFTLEVFVKLDTIELPNLPLTFTVINGTSNAASVSTAVGNTLDGRFQVNVFPDSLAGDVELEVDANGRKRRFPFRAGAVAGLYQDMWWGGGTQNGWGLSIAQHGDTIFAVLYVYDDAGRPTWYVLPSGTWDGPRRKYTGALYRPSGSPFFAYDASRFVVGAEVGTLTITFNGPSSGVIDYQIGTSVGTREIMRQPVGSNVNSTRPNRGDMYWGGVAQNGWGVAVMQQYDALFTVWFTYDANGAPTWYVLPAGTYAANGHYEGRMYRTTGSRWVGETYRPEQLAVIDVGPFRLRLADGVPTALEYTVEARSGVINLMRQGF